MLKNWVRIWFASVRAHWPYYLVVLGILLLGRYFWTIPHGGMAKVLKSIEEAHARGDLASTEEYMKASLPKAGRAAFYASLLLLLAGPWLTGPAGDVKVMEKGRQPACRWLWGVTLLMIAISAWLNAPRLSHSFWNDEEWTARRLIVGDFHSGEKSRHPGWEKTFFFYVDPNNHPLFSVLARLSNSLVPAPQAKNEFAFQEWPIRLPAYLFGLAGLAALAWFASVTGMARAGIVAVIWLALHPWHVRYGVDARGYSLLFAFLPLSMGLLWRALATGSMRTWVLYGVVEFFVLWTYPGALYFVMILNLVGCGMILTTPPPVGRWLQFRRFATANVLGGILTFLMLAPCVQPMVRFLHGERLRGALAPHWIENTLSGLFTGVTWFRWDEHEMALCWERVWDHAPWQVVPVLVLLAVAFIAGVVSLLRGGRARLWLLVLLLGVGPFMFIMARSQGNVLYSWYLVIGLPGLALVIGAGVEFLASRCLPKTMPCICCALFLIVFGIATWPQNNQLRRYSVEQMRESVAAMRPECNAVTGDRTKVLTASANFPARLYDPYAVPVKTPADLQVLMARADAEKLPLFINFGDKSFFRMRDPSLAALLDDTTKFEELPHFLGIHNQYERCVYRYRGKPQASP